MLAHSDVTSDLQNCSSVDAMLDGVCVWSDRERSLLGCGNMATEKVITCRQQDVMEMATRQEAGERFCTAIIFNIDFADGSVLASLHECWIAFGLTITQNKNPTYFHPPIDIFCFPVILILLLFRSFDVVGELILKWVLF